MDISSIEDELESRDLNVPILDVLRQDKAHYDTLLFQPSGKIKSSDNFVGNKNNASIKSKYIKFFEIAQKQNIHLAITPEYSCPWNVIFTLVKDGKNLPSNGSLWILGCESISKEDLQNLPDHGHLVWIFDDSIVDSPGNFVDPVCILFKTSDLDDTEKWVVVIQFKTHEMGGRGNFTESDNLIKGKKIYFLKNKNAATRLYVLICSDALNPNKDILINKMIHDPTLLIHVQLNVHPRHAAFSEYRTRLFDYKQEQLEILCLNWADETKINESEYSLSNNNSWGTAIYTKSKELLLDSKTIGLNDSLGMYATYWAPYHAMAYYCYNSEAILEIRNTPVSQTAMTGATAGRIGPRVRNVYKWNNKDWKQAKNFGNDWIGEACDKYQLDLKDFKINGFIDVLNVERFIALSSGQVAQSDWYDVKKLVLFQSDKNEMIKRISCNLDQSNDAINHRNNNLNRVSQLKKGLEEKSFHFPDRIKTLKDDSTLKYEFNKLKATNLYSNTSEKDTATVAYIGEWPAGESYPKENYDKMFKCLSGFEKQRFAMWFKSAGKVNVITLPGKPQINEDILDSTTSIIETRQAEIS